MEAAAAAPREGKRWRKGEWMVAVPGSGEGRSDGALRRGCCFALLPVGRREGEKRSTHALAFTLTEGGREEEKRSMQVQPAMCGRRREKASSSFLLPAIHCPSPILSPRIRACKNGDGVWTGRARDNESDGVSGHSANSSPTHHPLPFLLCSSVSHGQFIAGSIQDLDWRLLCTQQAMHDR